MSVRSTRFIVPAGLPVAGAVLYTVPSGRTALVRAVYLPNQVGIASVVLLALVIAGGGHDLWRGTVPAAGTTILQGPIIMHPGDQLFGTSNPGTVTCNIFGSLLLGAPA